MNLSELIKQFRESPAHKNFIVDNQESFLCAGFFILNLENPEYNKYSLDLFLPKEGKVATADFPFSSIKIQEDKIKPCSELIESQILIKSDEELKEKFEELKKQNNSTHQTNKLIVILKDSVWNITALSNALDILRVHINAKTNRCEKFEKVGLTSFVKVEKK
jgi:hypothetical protein